MRERLRIAAPEQQAGHLLRGGDRRVAVYDRRDLARECALRLAPLRVGGLRCFELLDATRSISVKYRR